MSGNSYKPHSCGLDESRMPSPGRPVLNKNLFMHNVCSCLDSCSAYIQALNSLCAAGTVLAHSLVQVFHELPPYRDVAEQFLGSWEELSRTTAGASAAVKTETLMALQEVLNALEGEISSHDSNRTVTDVIRSVGCCLTTYIELQAQFSLCCWKSLSRLSKVMSTDSMFFCPPRSFGVSDNGNSSGSLARGQELVNSVRKCFGQLLQKFNGSVSPGLDSSPVHQLYSSESPLPMRHGQVEPHLASFWPLLSNTYPSSSVTPSCENQQRQSSVSNEISSKPVPVSNELEDVLNLLSCQPSDLSASAAESVSFSSSNGPVSILNNPPQSGANHLWGHKDLSANSDSAVNVCSGSTYTNFEGKRTWPRMNDHTTQFNFNNQWPCYASRQDPSSVQSSQNCNVAWCSSSSGSGNRWSSGQGENGSSSEEDSLHNGPCQDGEVFSMGLSINLMDDLRTAGRQRRHSSNDGCQEGCHLELESAIKPTNSPWEPRAITKTSTWPLKQSSPRPLEPGCLLSQSPTSCLASPVPSGNIGKDILLSTPWAPPHHPPQDGATQDNIKESKYTLFGQMP